MNGIIIIIEILLVGAPFDVRPTLLTFLGPTFGLVSVRLTRFLGNRRD